MDFSGALGSVTVLQLVMDRVSAGHADEMYWRMSEYSSGCLRPFAFGACPAKKKGETDRITTSKNRAMRRLYLMVKLEL